MKIVLTTSMAGLGGTETATVRLGRLLRQHGHDIMLASSDGPLLKEAQALGIRWQPVDFYRGGLFGYLKGMIAYARMLRREQPDIIDCQMARVVPACAIAAKIVSPKTKIIYHSHGLDAATYPKIAKLFDKLGVYIIGNCKHEREKLIRHGFPADRIVYAYNALHHPPFLLGHAQLQLRRGNRVQRCSETFRRRRKRRIAHYGRRTRFGETQTI
ncbi:glycosyltransferase [Neisseria meningitidis]|uniref:glycosyltransferase n=1 Tax=Neisseria meningitidis TaxID=487 RepID=UPI0021ABA294|nr:glycosyltransferase [Neisseria meningitidis]